MTAICHATWCCTGQYLHVGLDAGQGRAVEEVDDALGQGHTLLVPVRDVPVAGRRTLTIVYTCACTDAPRTLDLRVNDDDPHSLPLRGAGNWEDPAKTRLTIRLDKGDNQIIFYNTMDPAPDLDRIEIT